MSSRTVFSRNFGVWSRTMRNLDSSPIKPVFKPHYSNPGKTKSFEKSLPYSETKMKPWEVQNISKDVFFQRKYGNISPEERNKLTEKVARQRRLRNMRKEHEREQRENARAERMAKSGRENHSDSEQYRVSRDRTPIGKNSLFEYVYGTHSVRSALESGKRSSYSRLYVHNCQDRQLIKIAETKYGVKIVERSSKNDLNILCNNGVHNGVVLETKSLELNTIHSLGACQDNEYKVTVYNDLDDAEVEIVKTVARTDPVEDEPVAKMPLGIFLDGITDPQNMGGIIRSAYYFGVDFIVVPGSHTAKLGPVANKASVGAMDLIDIYETNESLKFIDRIRANGWSVVSTSAKPSVDEINDLKSKHEKVEQQLKNKYVDMNELPNILSQTPVLLVMGSEGEGIRTHMKLRSDFLVGIDKGRKQDHIVDSLNVSVASGILIGKCLE